ncbi:agamous-like MADS-box protein AGL62 [Cynara cardunculus var. scolymus]|uniref:Transcription factor, MADS-box n=1 Tax=Cynara cardunculus var. scolymus TaxID=59895 RepID=A0A103YHS3_CYNCS|nr:agamous-like MADS-box protein AGL62 [Cynara cardunculus var. scolymus]KVI09341.1 Transcription factor, MADS-box [Cynara cardunculus var. scolymus]
MIETNAVGGNNMKKKASQGRKKIEIKRIEEVNNRQVTFSKRRAGLFKKASELCILTGAQIAILVNSPGGRVFAFGHPTADALIDRYLSTPAAATGSTSDGTSSSQKPLMVKEFNQHYVEVSKELEAEKKRKEVIQESKMVNGGSGLAWYDETIDELELEELQQYLSSLVELKRKVLVRADELMMIKKAPALLGPNMLDMGQVSNHIPNIEIMPSNMMAPVGFNFGPAMDYQPR